MEIVKFILWVMISIIILITLYLAFIYYRLNITIKKLSTKDNIIDSSAYPCYLNMILSGSIAINNLIRLITTKEGFFCYCQAFVLVFFDKLIFTTITVNVYLTYKGLSDNEFYMKNIKLLYIISNSLGILISLVVSVSFIFKGVTLYENVCYVNADTFKETTDTIITFLLYTVFLFCSIKSIILLVRNIKELSLTNNSSKAHLLHFYRMIVSLYLSSLFFFVSLLIINNSLFFDDNYIDLFYITNCLVMDLFYTLNQTVVKESKSLCSCKKNDDMPIDVEESEDGDRTRSSVSLDIVNDYY
jgi:hypothetical protein